MEVSHGREEGLPDFRVFGLVGATSNAGLSVLLQNPKKFARERVTVIFGSDQGLTEENRELQKNIYRDRAMASFRFQGSERHTGVGGAFCLIAFT
eukprot:9019242-Pyramimonas_sp.AAC.1